MYVQSSTDSTGVAQGIVLFQQHRPLRPRNQHSNSHLRRVGGKAVPTVRRMSHCNQVPHPIVEPTSIRFLGLVPPPKRRWICDHRKSSCGSQANGSLIGQNRSPAHSHALRFHSSSSPRAPSSKTNVRTNQLGLINWRAVWTD